MSARQRDLSSSNDDYCYVNEDGIDSNLRCLICQQPLLNPMVGKQCEHAFCKVCINDWYKRDSSCPTCRSNTSFRPLTTRIVLSQLDCLLVRCLHCNQNNIQRGDWSDHIQHRCRQVTVKCKAADLKCSWKGKREEQEQHSSVCPLVKIQPVVEELRGELQAQALQLQIFKNEVKDQLSYLQTQSALKTQSNTPVDAVGDKNKSEKERFDELMNDLRYRWTKQKHYEDCAVCIHRYNDYLTCLICARQSGRHNIAIHDSYVRSVKSVICTICTQKYGK